jgi:hypothetical protein
MSVLDRKRSRKSLPSRSVSPTCFNPGVFLRIGTSQCSVIRDDLKMSEIITSKHKMRDYGFQVSLEEQQPSLAPNTSSHDSSLSNSISSAELSVINLNQEIKKVVRKQLPNGERCCASCGATKTPYWRDAWGENISLCNACGLRYAKFKKRCSLCHYVPRKEDKNGRCCSQCRGSWL